MKHLLSLADCSREQLAGLLALAAEVKAEPARYREALAGKTLAMIFQKPSTRTRVSFEVGMYQLGGHGLYLSGRDMQLGRGESIPDTARVLSRYVDGILARVFAHSDVEALSQGTVPVINGLSDLLHPCQILADFLTLQEHKGQLDGLVLAYVGDGNNVAHSLINGGALAGVAIRVATPAGYEPDPAIVAAARSAGGTVEVMRDPAAAVDGADAIYTDVWASMGQEDEHAARLRTFSDYQVNEELFGKAKSDAIFLHCLPAHRGEEVTDGVVDHPRSVVFDEAENRLHTQKAVLLHLMAKTPLPAH
ncbi:MAG: ornithine carbamoyltransferase [Myxococcota bacterium]